MRGEWKASCLLLGLFLSVAISTDALAKVSTEEAIKFVRQLKEVFLEPGAMEATTVGVEIELNRLSAEKVAEIVKEEVGGIYDQRYKIEDTTLGEVEVYPDGIMWEYTDWMRDSNYGMESRLRRLIYSVLDSFQTNTEVVFPPVKASEVGVLDKINELLGGYGAEGSHYFSLTATQVNIGVDPTDTLTLRYILGNYIKNKEVFRKYLNPQYKRQKSVFLMDPKPSFAKKLVDPDYVPAPEQFWKDFLEGQHIKFSRVNIGIALLADLSFAEEEKQAFIDANWGVRPAVEFREGDSRFVPGYLTDLTELGVALVEASKKHILIDAEYLERAAREKEKLNSYKALRRKERCDYYLHYEKPGGDA